MDPFRRPANWVKLECPSKRVFGFASDAVGTIKVRCTAKECRREGVDTLHLFNLSNGLCVTEHVPQRPYRWQAEAVQRSA